MNQELHVAVQAAHKKKNILTLINIFACTRETIIYFPLKIDAYNYSSFLQIQLVGKISASLFPLELVQKQNNGFRMLF